MKRISFASALIVFIGICAASSVSYGSRRGEYQVVEVYVCEEAQVLAEMVAKTLVNRQELTTVSYCTCEGVDPGQKGEVKKTKCDPPKDMVYACTCIGRTGY